mmetsp:Transcript_29649/g.54374  ORF Transcript_29649/g.54374 Transcript_29649/m.54374 type:complete len:321 (-) Transcript_29649:734-1696(-)|eukprot:CAMPEP_0175072746 /NCGR_PEP_ID=MMETSP0052_2-20121109/20099_1 /TAXON_ID=51329 ORGANISM="Polytomella parva, Strain SAG 63-3" /NCGR_SAMPLE_ID=MMETSP0052_2 /ASSEMBLY_ACC=CAM_ASM_000194 /LENGTH=320 /DNA_ID=CAMNT_0016340321 /DNA_START=115 /DNA_END=1077 /DNA_ORIENTATION=+
MGKGQRHSKNAGVMGSEALSYAERRALGFGTVKERLGKDSLGNYYDCCLTLQKAEDPVLSPHGYLYSREAILENLLEQKKAIKRKLAEWEAAQKNDEQQAQETAAIAEGAKLVAFDRQNNLGASASVAAHIQSEIEKEAAFMREGVVKSSVSTRDAKERLEAARAFWIPSKVPEAARKVDKPDVTATVCPASGYPLRLKDLITVKFSPARPGEGALHIDPLTKESLTNATKLVVLRPTGAVLTKASYEKCVKPDGVYEGVAIDPAKDVIELQTGGTGFAGRDGEKVQSKKRFLLGPGSGLADLRGQHQGPRSLGGLAQWN